MCGSGAGLQRALPCCSPVWPVQLEEVDVVRLQPPQLSLTGGNDAGAVHAWRLLRPWRHRPVGCHPAHGCSMAAGGRSQHRRAACQHTCGQSAGKPAGPLLPGGDSNGLCTIVPGSTLRVASSALVCLLAVPGQRLTCVCASYLGCDDQLVALLLLQPVADVGGRAVGCLPAGRHWVDLSGVLHRADQAAGWRRCCCMWRPLSADMLTGTACCMLQYARCMCAEEMPKARQCRQQMLRCAYNEVDAAVHCVRQLLMRLLHGVLLTPATRFDCS